MSGKKLSEKGKIAYLCVLFLVLAFSVTAWRTSQGTQRIIAGRFSQVSEETHERTTEKESEAKDANTPITNIPDQRPTTTEPQTLFEPLKHFSSPVNGKILKHFSNGELVKNESTGDWRTHNGTDIACKSGTAVKAINNGIVTAVYTDTFWGTVVEIDHGNGVTAKYCGLDANVSVEKDRIVKAEEKIGTVGSVPLESSEETHLHIEIRVRSTLINPLDLLQ